MLAKNLERLIEMETDLKTQYQAELNSKSTQITRAIEKQDALKVTISEHKATIAKQLEQIKSYAAASSDTKRIEQLNRELNARSAKLQDEVDTQKKRIRSLQKDLSVERDELKVLKKLDPQKLKKNQDTAKKKLADKTTANELLQKSFNKFKKENEELKKKVKELEEKVASSETEEGKEEDVAAEKSA